MSLLTNRTQVVLGTFAATALIAAIGWLDLETGPDFGFSLFYLLPVMACGVWLGVWSALITAIAASATWFAADIALAGAAGAWLSVWNGFTRLVIFVVVGTGAASLQRSRERLRALLNEAESLARTDAVTELPNMRAFIEAADIEIVRARRQARPVCVLYLDLDGFKKINDEFGHDEGNRALRAIGAALRQILRSGDVPARIGGDEFAVLLADVEREEAEIIAGRIIKRIESFRRDYPGSALGASVGLVHVSSDAPAATELLKVADAAMYEAKTTGKGRVVVRTSSDA